MRLRGALPAAAAAALLAGPRPTGASPVGVVEQQPSMLVERTLDVLDAASSLYGTVARQVAPEDKYFHEPGGSNALAHYDSRFFRAEVPYDEHRRTLLYLIRSWLTVTRELELETWLAHGTLLGWWWNGRIMPWDTDLDVQISGPSARRLAEAYNQTLHEFVVSVDNTTGAATRRSYMVDVNPHYAELSRNQGANVIDGRWIDTSTGMYIDITVLLERSPSFAPGVWSCKNFHRYLTRDLFPLRETEFEGVPALVPNRVEKALEIEYGTKSMTDTEYGNHRFDQSVKEWVRTDLKRKK